MLPLKISLILILGFIFSVLTLINLETGLFLLIFVVPFTYQITVGKISHGPIDIGTDDIFIMFIIFSWLVWLARGKKPAFLKTPLNWPLVAFFTAGACSFIGADERFGTGAVLLGALHLFKFFEYVAIYFIVISAIKNYDQIRKFIIMFFIVAAVIVVVQFIPLKTGMGILEAALSKLTLMYALISNAVVGAYHAFFLSILLAIILDTPVPKGKIPLLLLACIFSFALFNTYSRSAYLGIFASCLVLAILKEKRMFVVILLLIIISPVLLQSTVQERITMTVQNVQPRLVVDASTAIRLGLWKQAVNLFLNRPFFGMGFWTTRFLIGSSPHSSFLALLAETGIVGVLIFCWLVIRMFKNAMNLIRRADTSFLKSLGVGYVAGLTAILTSCITSETLETFQVIGPVWFMTGLISSANRLLLEKTDKLGVDST